MTLQILRGLKHTSELKISFSSEEIPLISSV